jgi:hypothetical protein
MGRFFSSPEESAGIHFEAQCNAENRTKTGALNSPLQVADERSVQTSAYMECHLRNLAFFSQAAHCFSKRLFNSR